MGILEKIDAEREKQRPVMTQGELEERAGLAKNRVAKWRDGQGVPTGAQVLRIARVLGVPVEYLLDDEMTEPGEAESLNPQDRTILELAHELGYRVARRRLIAAPEANGEAVPESRPARKRAHIEPLRTRKRKSG